jgi:hypothetical protein
MKCLIHKLYFLDALANFLCDRSGTGMAAATETDKSMGWRTRWSTRRRGLSRPQYFTAQFFTAQFLKYPPA